MAEEVAKNEAVGQMSNLGVGLGVMTGIGTGVGGKVSDMATQALNSMPNGEHERGIRFCQNCGHQIPIGAGFCELCGEKICNNRCTNCGAELSDVAKFCPICGTKRG